MAYDSEYDGRMIAATRNIEAIFVTLNHFEGKRAADAKRVEDLLMTLAQQSQQINKLTQQVTLLQAQLYEAGVR
jgi:hypothetical protein